MYRKPRSVWRSETSFNSGRSQDAPLEILLRQAARAGGLGSAVDRGEQDDQLFLEVTAKNAAARW